MHGLILLYALVFVPISSPHVKAIDTARKAFVIQTGAKAEWDRAKGAVEKKMPPTLKHAAGAYSVVRKKELKLKHGPWRLDASSNAAVLTFTIKF